MDQGFFGTGLDNLMIIPIKTGAQREGQKTQAIDLDIQNISKIDEIRAVTTVRFHPFLKYFKKE